MIFLQVLPTTADAEKYIDKAWDLGPEPVYGILVVFAWVMLAGAVVLWIREQKATSKLRDEKEILLKQASVDHSLDTQFEAIESKLKEGTENLGKVQGEVTKLRSEVQTTITLIQNFMIQITSNHK